MDIASLAGLLLGVAMCILGIVTSGGVEAFGNFVDIPSVFVTIGGSLSSVLSSHKLNLGGVGVTGNLSANVIAKEADVKELWLTHYSPSLSRPDEYKEAVREIFPNTKITRDKRSVTLDFDKNE